MNEEDKKYESSEFEVLILSSEIPNLNQNDEDIGPTINLLHSNG